MDSVNGASPYLAIDADGHVHEAEELFTTYLPEAFRARAPGPKTNAQGVRRYIWPEEGTESPPFPAEISIRKPMKAADRLKVLDKERVWAAVLFPSGALAGMHAKDIKLAEALATAYGDWMHDYVAPFKDRLHFAAPLPLQNVDWACVQARRAVELGARAIVVRPNPRDRRTWDDPSYDPFYATVQELAIPLIFHESTGDSNTAGGDRYGIRNASRYAFNHAISHPFEQMFASMSLICGGVLERFPTLRIGFAEAGCSWLIYWLARLDNHFEHRILGKQMPIKMKPSEYFKRQCFTTCDPDDDTVALAIAAIGDDHIAFATDYPHFDSAGGSVRKLLSRPGLSPEAARKILWQNAERIYGLKMPAAV